MRKGIFWYVCECVCVCVCVVGGGTTKVQISPSAPRSLIRVFLSQVIAYFTIPLKGSDVNPCHAELIKMPRPLQIFSQSNYLIQNVDNNSYTELQTVQVQISWLLRSQLSGSTLFAKAGHIRVLQDKG